MTPPAPFQVKDCALISVALGVSAHNLRELRDRISAVPLQCLYHHFYEALLRPSFDDPEFPNDFAQWTRHELHDDVVAERLGIIDPLEHRDGESFRQDMVEILEDRISEVGAAASAAPGREFQFLRSKIVVFDTGIQARTLTDLIAIVPSLRSGSVFYHFVDARFRPPRGEDDLSVWLAQWGKGTERVVEKLRRIDVGFGSLADLREQIGTACRGLPGAAGAVDSAPVDTANTGSATGRSGAVGSATIDAATDGSSERVEGSHS